MSERRFYIAEIEENDGTYKNPEVITESVLRRWAIQMFNAQWTCADDVRIDILLHGSGEKGDDLPPREMRAEPYYKKLGEGEKEVKVNHEQFEAVRAAMPSPAPTRAEWEAWINRFPWVYLQDCTVMGTGYDNGAERLRDWFKSMPIIPKE
ncbi:MAG: hypothetical protein WC444_06320 [Candidatus Paceibacterota bacterium]